MKTAANDRPLEYTAEIGRTICGRLVDGESLQAICTDPGMPDRDTIRDWVAHHEDFRKSYELAQTLPIDLLEDEILEIIDDASGDRVEKARATGRVVMVIDRENIARSRLMAAVRSWVADRRPPRKYEI